LTGEGSPDALQWVVVSVHHPLFELNDGVVGDLNASGANFGAASRDVAIFNAELLFDFRDTVFNVQGVHFVLGEANEVSRSCEIVKQFVIAEHVAGVYAQKALDAFTEMLDSVGLHLIEFPVHGFWTVDGRNALGNLVVPTDIGHQIFHVRKRLHWTDLNGLASRGFGNNIAHSSHAHQTWATVDLGGTRAAFPGLAVPANRHVRLLFVLNAMEAIEHHHAFIELEVVRFEFSFFALASEDVERLCGAFE
jgi:hypothetical protein